MGKDTQTITLAIGGMTCHNCQERLERAFLERAGVRSATVDYAKGTAVIVVNQQRVEQSDLTDTVTSLGYTVLPAHQTKWHMVARTTGLLAMIVLLYLALERFGVLNLFVPSALATAETGHGMLFVIGLLTSVHCVAMCGGINLSQCIGAQALKPEAKQAQIKPALLYNVGRVISYTIIGFFVGALGATISLSYLMQGMLKIGAGLLMLIMGFSMLGLFPSLSRLIPRMPKRMKRMIEQSKLRGRGPLVVGLLNGFMPCGPLQAMQLYALSTGSALAGAFSMLLYSLGTVPLMLGLGILGTALGRSFTRQVMMAGAVLVAVMGLSMFSQGASLAGWFQGIVPSAVESTDSQMITPITASAVDEASEDTVPAIQHIASTLESYRYPNITVQVGVPVSWNINAPRGSINGCNDQLVIPEYDLTHAFAYGDNLITFTPETVGTFTYTCWMGMIRATITVVEDASLTPDATEEPLKSDPRFSDA